MTRTLRFLRDRGLPVEIVERRRGPKTIDWAGCIDIQTAFQDVGASAPRVVCIQLTDGSHFAHRMAKVEAHRLNLLPWMKAGVLVEAWAWSHLVGRGRVRRPRWELRRRRFQPQDPIEGEVLSWTWIEPPGIEKL